MAGAKRRLRPEFFESVPGGPNALGWRWHRPALANVERGHEGVKPEMTIRKETDGDVNAIAEVTVAALRTLAISNHKEQFIIEALRAANALSVSLVAEVDGRVVGHPGLYHALSSSRTFSTGKPTTLL